MGEIVAWRYLTIKHNSSARNKNPFKDALIYLQSAVECTLYGDAFGVMCAVGGDCGDQVIEFFTFLFQLLHKTLNGSFGKRFTLATLPMTHQTSRKHTLGVNMVKCVCMCVCASDIYAFVRRKKRTK